MSIMSLSALVLFVLFQSSISTDTIASNSKLKDIDSDALLSSGGVFVLGFFNPKNSSGVRSRYVGIWYKRDPSTVVWVANRDDPINDTSGFLTIESQNLVLYRANQTAPVWSTTVSTTTAGSNVTVRLLDSGNLVLGSESDPLWKSFDHPTDTQLPYAKIGIDYRTGLNRILTSWKSVDDPGTGTWSHRVDTRGYPQMFVYQGSVPKWRSGPWVGSAFSGIPQTAESVSTTYINNENETTVTYAASNDSILMRNLVNQTGDAQGFVWDNRDRIWTQFWGAPAVPCDNYGHCGVDSLCDSTNDGSFECTCLPGYEPKSAQEWYQHDGSDGCIRNTNLSMCQNGEGFVEVSKGVKLPDTSTAVMEMGLGSEACEQKCLKICSCVAYANVNVDQNGGTGCLTWSGNLMDARTYSNAGEKLYVRVDSVELALYAKKGSLSKAGLIAIIVASIVSLMVLVILAYLLIKNKRRARRNGKLKSRFEAGSTKMEVHVSQSDIELPLFDLETIAAATNNFSLENQLGSGGFGEVYKGVLFDDTEIAVKRLSRNSNQGIEEFKNEIALLAKLQHRNLVKILGFCISNDEKILIYEYLNNKSLDSFIFDITKRALLNWEKRMEIICGIARGMSYLHHDSRLRIIHRDLKASNVLLDSDMNPKVSDFGMARIFGGEQVQGTTTKIVGTYGYMPPEYAMAGQFSIKSDTYSFGVLLLEIISGGRNAGYYPESPTLAGHVWELWKEGTAIEIIDPLIESCPAHEALRCIQIGLLCVQEQAADRPTMAAVVGMLSTDTALPKPNRPAFVVNIISNTGHSSRSIQQFISANEVTITMVLGR